MNQLLPPRRTRRVSSSELQLPSSASVAFATDGTEDRSRLPAWQDVAISEPSRCIVITRQTQESIEVQRADGSRHEISLRDQDHLKALLPRHPLYLDISGMSHSVWAPLIKAARDCQIELNVVYAEPLQYQPHSSPTSPTVFDLSTGFAGMAPLPGFVRLSSPPDPGESLLIAMLGFEGSRPLHLALQHAELTKVVPIVGVPGFRIEYPAATIASNRELLDEYQAHSELRYARASCPFEAYHVLAEIRRAYPNHFSYIAPVGTKPHALAAVMFALDHPHTTELLYDHPIRKPGRTSGVGTIHIYNLSGPCA